MSALSIVVNGQTQVVQLGTLSAAVNQQITQAVSSATSSASTATAAASTATTEAGVATTAASTATTEAQAAATSAAASANAYSAIANGAATDAGALTGAEVVPVSRGSGLLSTTLTKIANWLTSLWLNQRLLQWAYASAFRLVSATRDTNEAIVTASIVWPDGATGTFTTDTTSIIFLGAIDAWHATYINGSITHTVTQPLVTRDANGAVIAQPAITIS